MRRLVPLLLALVACEAEAPKAAYGDADLLAELDGYEDWDAPEGWSGLSVSCDGSHGGYVRLYVNDVAAADLAADAAELSEGAILVNASFQDEDGTPKFVGAMRKVDGFAPDAGDWYWAHLDETGALVVAGQVAACAACHADAPDYVQHRVIEPPAGPDGCN